MVCVCKLTATVCEAVAAIKLLLPACDAVMVQDPVAINEAVVPVTVHTVAVVEAKVTVRPEVAVADRVTCVPTVWGAAT
jgi:hypothetical protein